MNRAGVPALVIATTLVLLVGAGEAAAPAPLTVPQRLELGVVAVEARVGGDAVHGSGTVVDGERGLVLTSVQAVWGATSLKLGTGLGILHGRIVARAPCDGLALVETQPRVPGLVSLAATPGPAPSPGALVSANGRRLAGPGDAARLRIPARVASVPLRLDAALVPEAGGGPILDARGRLVGVAAADGTTIAWDFVRARLEALRPGARRVFGGWREQYGCVARLNAATSAAHPAFRPRDARLTAPVPATRIPGSKVVDDK